MNNHIISIEDCRDYASEANLDKGLKKLGLDEFYGGEEYPLRYMKVRNSEGRWTAVFLVSEYFNINKTGGYIGFVADKGFMSI